MKFGKQLRDAIHSPWRFHYIDYTSLKHTLKERTQHGSYVDGDEASFAHILDAELDKVHQFHSIKMAEVLRRVEYCECAVADLDRKTPVDVKVGSVGSHISADLDEEYAIVEDEINQVMQEVGLLQKFAQINYTGFVKIVKKHDKLTPFTLRPVFMGRLNAKPFVQETYEGLILKLSRLYDIVRNRGHPTVLSAAMQAGGSAQNFVRRTTKYWVHPDNVLELKMYILKYLPVLIFNAQDDAGAAVDPAITSIYLDNESLDLYLGRLEKHDNAEAIRLRWYGPVTNPEIFVERKTHKEDWTGEKSVKQRFPIKEKYVNGYLSGEWTVEHMTKKLRARGQKSESDIVALEELAAQIQASIKTKKLVPCMRTFYNRTAFQLPGDARVRISLDTQLTMIREDDFDGIRRALPNWRRKDAKTDYPFAHLPESEICRFPYAVLEVKLQTQVGTEEPQWVKDLIGSHLVEEVPKFSKFVHGCATLLESRVPLLPFWLPQMDKDIRRPPQSTLGLGIGVGSRESLLSRDLAQERKASRKVSSSILGIGKRKSTLAITEGEDASLREVVVKKDASPRPSTVHDAEITEESPLLPESSASGARRHVRRISETSSHTRRRHVFGALGGLFSRRFTPFSRAASPPRHMHGGVPATAGPNHKRVAIPVRVEPKVFFANERTFLSWIHFAVVLGGLALGLLNFGDRTGVIAGVLFTAIAMGIMIYALWLYKWRAHQIRHKLPGPYDDEKGPIVLVVVIVSAVLINFWLKFTSVAS